MYEHFKNIEYLYGDNSYVQIPNSIFRDLSKAISGNIQQLSFAYCYMVTIAFLYKYTHFVDMDNGTYIQNSDIKQILGYGKRTKTVDKIIKKNGVLEQNGFIRTSKDYPVRVEYTDNEVNGMSMREFITINSLSSNDINYNTIKSIVKNRNYEIREPIFLFENNDDIGTLYNYENTHKITINEFMKIIYDNELDNIDFILYSFFKSKCYGYKFNLKSMALYKIVGEIGIGKDCFYSHLKILKDKNYISVIHKNWSLKGNSGEAEANEYYFKGV